jgi:hypothetical protein
MGKARGAPKRHIAEREPSHIACRQSLRAVPLIWSAKSTSASAACQSSSSCPGSNPRFCARKYAAWAMRSCRVCGSIRNHFSTTGSADPGLYPAAAAPGVVTSANGSPDTKGWIAELNYLSWLNTKLSLQYTTYTQFNGGNSNYDGFGRNASANGSTYLLLWLTF